MQSSKSISPRQNNEVLAILTSTFPVFRDCLPLAVGIHKAIQATIPDLDKEQLRTGLKLHTGSTRYLKSLTSGESRFGLDGAPSGTVTPEQHQQASEVLRQRFKKIADRKKAEQQARQLQESILKLAERFNSR